MGLAGLLRRVGSRTGILRRKGPVIEIDLVALRHGAGFNGRPKSHGTSTELESQRNAANSTRASRQSNRTRRRVTARLVG